MCVHWMDSGAIDSWTKFSLIIKSPSLMSPNLRCMGTSTNKIIPFGTITIHNTSKNVRCITKKPLFGEKFWLAVQHQSIILWQRHCPAVLIDDYQFFFFFLYELDDPDTNDAWSQQEKYVQPSSFHIRHSSRQKVMLTDHRYEMIWSCCR